MTRSYRQIVADYRRQYPPTHQVRLRNTGDWRNDHCSRAHYQATGGALVLWFEKDAAGASETVFGFRTADQAAAFRRWADTCGIDWTVEPCQQPLPHPPKPPERPTMTPGYTGHSGGPSPGGRGTPGLRRRPA